MEIEIKEESVLDSLVIKEESAIEEQPYHQSEKGCVFKEESIENFMKTEFANETITHFEITEVDEAPVQVTHRRKPRRINKYHCAHCPETFYNKLELESHLCTHRKVLFLTCRKCRKLLKFKTPELLREHTNNCFQKRRKCLDCNGKFTATCDASGHVKDLGKKSRLFRCPFCYDFFKTEKQLKSHKLEHSSIKCPYCESFFVKPKSAALHIAKDHRGLPPNPTRDPPTCTICNKEYSSFERLKKHVMVHNIEKGFQCGSCKNIYRTVIDIEDHVVNEHEGLPLPPGFPDVWTVYTCSLTGKTFPAVQRVNLKKVPRAPRAEYECPDCKVTFSNRNLLDQHMLMDQPPLMKTQEHEILQCRFCAVIHTSQENLQDHEEQHTQDERVNSLFLLLKKAKTQAKTATAVSKTAQHSRSPSSADYDYYVYIE